VEAATSGDRPPGAAAAQSGNLPRVTPEKWQLVHQIVKEEPDLTIPEVAEEFWRRSGTKVS